MDRPKRLPLHPASDCSDHADRGLAADGRVEAALLAHVHTVDVDVDERPELAALVEQQVGDRQRAERVADAVGGNVEPPATAR